MKLRHFLLPPLLLYPFWAGAQSSDLDADGNVGRTSYITLPLQTDFALPSWGATGGQSPTNLFWDSGAIFTNPATVRNAQEAARTIAASGRVPFGGIQRWQETYMSSFPPQPGEPPWVISDRRDENMLHRGDYQAWAKWESAHANLFVLTASGGQAGSQYHSWFGTWGHISPMMPLPQADWPRAWLMRTTASGSLIAGDKRRN